MNHDWVQLALFIWRDQHIVKQLLDDLAGDIEVVSAKAKVRCLPALCL